MKVTVRKMLPAIMSEIKLKKKSQPFVPGSICSQATEDMRKKNATPWRLQCEQELKSKARWSFVSLQKENSAADVHSPFCVLSVLLQPWGDFPPAVQIGSLSERKCSLTARHDDSIGKTRPPRSYIEVACWLGSDETEETSTFPIVV